MKVFDLKSELFSFLAQTSYVILLLESLDFNQQHICQLKILNQIIQNVFPHDSYCSLQAKQPGLASVPV